MSADAKYPWSVLGLPKMPDDAAISRKAYARALKQIDQSKDIQGFETLRAAYDRAMQLHKMASRAKTAPQTQAGSALQTDPQPIAPAPPPQTPLESPPQTQMPPSAPAMQGADLQTMTAPPDGVPNLQMTLQALGTIRSDISFSRRVKDALESPWAKDPMTAGAIRTGIAAALRAMPTRLWVEHDNLHLEITADILHRLDSEYRWLTDATSFERDFGQSFDLMHHLLVRNSGGSIPNFKALPKPKKGLASALDWLSKNMNLVFFMFGITLFATSLLPNQYFSVRLIFILFAALFVFVASIGLYFVQIFLYYFFIRINYYQYTARLASMVVTASLGSIIYVRDLNFSIFAISFLIVILVPLSLIKPKAAAQFESKLVGLWGKITAHFDK